MKDTIVGYSNLARDKWLGAACEQMTSTGIPNHLLNHDRWENKPQEDGKRTTYGRDNHSISLRGFFNRTQAGLAGLLKLEQELKTLSKNESSTILLRQYTDVIPQDHVERLVFLGEVAAKSLDNIRQFKTKMYGAKFKEKFNAVPLEITASINIEYVGYSADTSHEIMTKLAHYYRQGKMAGLIYLGAFGHSANTPSEDYIKMAKKLIAQGYLVISSGCVGAALAAAGLCHPNYNDGDFPLKDLLPERIPPVLYMGTSCIAGEFVCIAQAAGELPILAVLTGNEYNRVLVSAIAFATMGINTWLDQKNIFNNTVIAGWLSNGLATKCGTQVLPFISVEDFLHSLGEAETSH